ncbi:TAXI family TRAP transporter solute-binding subunit [Teichococcus aestuarii]|uniref:C4-dicarboxylate ABC transporter substrate-binding protein n=1 Tax=Teichococcus aestuarii TaxID=568898 RepID=A0A2U1UYE5_9PROT|nr:TAXI family TRAP transporter solute-binding subunit [Pseudoroseomonas aestuarii]PWC26674.1 C4-dicarboxylate ABC transporter substrate-binding protein [Pseudoroseomonas aestuarii]
MRKTAILGMALASGFAASLATPAGAEQLRFMTGPQGGSWIPLGGALKNIWEHNVPDLSLQVVPGAGVINVRGVGEGKAGIAFANSISTVDGLQGRAPFPGKVSNVCNIGSLYPQWFQLVVLGDSGISRVEDLKGRSVAIQPRGNTAEVITQQLLKVAGLSYDDIKPNFQTGYTDAVGLMKDGHAQAFTLGTTIPASAVMDLASAREMRLLDLSAYSAGMQKINEAYRLNPLPAGTYPQQQGTPSTITYTTHIITQCDRDADQVYRMTKAMWENVGTLRNVVGSMKQADVKFGAQDISVPMHEGAKRYYREANALAAK